MEVGIRAIQGRYALVPDYIAGVVAHQTSGRIVNFNPRIDGRVADGTLLFARMEVHKGNQQFEGPIEGT